MRIVVCIKQVPDPEGPQDCFQINSDPLRVEPKGIPPVLSLFDENALGAALRIKDERPEEETGEERNQAGRIRADEDIEKEIAEFEQELGLNCPLCGTAGIRADETARGKLYYHCTNDMCNFISWGKPFYLDCPQCKNPFLIESTTSAGNPSLFVREQPAITGRIFPGMSLKRQILRKRPLHR